MDDNFFLIGSGIFFVGLGVYFMGSSLLFRRDFITMYAVIADNIYKPGKSLNPLKAGTYTQIVVFKYEGKTYEVSTKTETMLAEPKGKKVKVRFDPKDPSEVDILGPGTFMLPYIFIFLGVCLFLWGIYSFVSPTAGAPAGNL